MNFISKIEIKLHSNVTQYELNSYCKNLHSIPYKLMIYIIKVHIIYSVKF